MFGPPGTLYVYLSYGVHWCVNVVVGPPGEPSAVLLRGGEVVEGRTTVIERRGRTSSLADGPGKLGQALGLDGAASGSNIWDGPLILRGPLATVDNHRATQRIGITRATDRLWRFTESS
jgi:DNA-3-methyladenine glycosylase